MTNRNTKTKSCCKHLLGFRKRGMIPSEIFLVLSVLNIEPNCVTGNAVLSHKLIHFQGLFLGHVVPPALVVAKTEKGWHRHLACKEEEIVGLNPWV